MRAGYPACGPDIRQGQRQNKLETIVIDLKKEFCVMSKSFTNPTDPLLIVRDPILKEINMKSILILHP